MKYINVFGAQYREVRHDRGYTLYVTDDHGDLLPGWSGSLPEFHSGYGIMTNAADGRKIHVGHDGAVYGSSSHGERVYVPAVADVWQLMQEGHSQDDAVDRLRLVNAELQLLISGRGYRG